MYGYGKKAEKRADLSKINMEFDLNNAKLRNIDNNQCNE